MKLLRIDLIVSGFAANYGPSGSGGYGRSGSRSGEYNFVGMLQMSEQAFKLWDQDFTVGAILAAELYGNTESHSWSKSTNGGLVIPGYFSFSNSKITGMRGGSMV